MDIPHFKHPMEIYGLIIDVPIDIFIKKPRTCLFILFIPLFWKATEVLWGLPHFCSSSNTISWFRLFKCFPICLWIQISLQHSIALHFPTAPLCPPDERWTGADPLRVWRRPIFWFDLQVGNVGQFRWFRTSTGSENGIYAIVQILSN